MRETYSSEYGRLDEIGLFNATFSSVPMSPNALNFLV